MRLATLSAVAAAALAASAASAADVGTPPPAADMHVPPPAAGALYGTCPPPAVHASAGEPLRQLTNIIFRNRNSWVQPPRVVTVAPFETTLPGPQIEVPVQTAYLASSACPPSLGHSPGGSWYDGKLFYYEGATPQRPDAFMVVVEPAQVHIFQRQRWRWGMNAPTYD